MLYFVLGGSVLKFFSAPRLLFSAEILSPVLDKLLG